MNTRPPLVVITGPTASGKSQLALELAELYGGEIICADSRTVYKGMDIGTAKPNQADQTRVKHWLLDVVQPGERFTAHDFQTLAYTAIDDIRSRGKIPFLVGGTGLYVDSVVLGFTFGPEADEAVRARLEKMTIEELQTLLKEQRIPLPENRKNKRYLIRSYEKNNEEKQIEKALDPDTVVIAITPGRDALDARIRTRIDEMFNQGITTETQQLIRVFGPDSEAMTGNIYSIVSRVISGEISVEQAKIQAFYRDRQLAKRQVTWLKRHHYVKWLSIEEAKTYLNTYLNSAP